MSNRQTIAEKANLFQISLRAQKRGGRLPVLEDETHELLQLSKKVSNLGYLELIEGGWKTDQGHWTCWVPIHNTAEYTGLPAIVRKDFHNSPAIAHSTGQSEVFTTLMFW